MEILAGIWGEGYVALGGEWRFGVRRRVEILAEIWGEGYVALGGGRRFCGGDLG